MQSAARPASRPAPYGGRPFAIIVPLGPTVSALLANERPADRKAGQYRNHVSDGARSFARASPTNRWTFRR